MDLNDAFRRAASDHKRGATEIERDLVRDLLEAKDVWIGSDLAAGARTLLRSQPAMANLRRLAAVLKGADTAGLEDALQRRFDVLVRLGPTLAAAGSEVVAAHDRVITISRSSAVLAILVGAFERGWRGSVVVLDGTPAGCGPDQAARLAALGVDVQSLPDGAVFEAFDHPSIATVVLVGADAVGPHRIVNAQGTHLLLELAAGLRVHRAVVADSGKDLSEEEVEEVIAASRRHEEAGPGRSWPVFETVPRELVSERISEHGRMLW